MLAQATIDTAKARLLDRLQAFERNGEKRFRAAVLLPSFDGETLGGLQVMPEGVWLGHPDGEFELDDEVFDKIIANFEAEATPTTVDYDHEVGPAAGWITRLYKQQTDDGVGLFAEVKFTKRCADMIRAGEYLYCSPEWSGNAKDPKSGKRIGPYLAACAMTNRPFLDGMAPAWLMSRDKAALAAAKDSPMPDDKKPEDKPAVEEKPGAPAPEEEPKAAAEEPAAEPGSEAPAALNAFVDGVCEVSGGDKAAVLAVLNELTDPIGKLVRTKLDQDGGAADKPKEIPMSEPAAQKPADEKAKQDEIKASEIEAKAKDNEVKILASRLSKLETENATIKASIAQIDADKAATIKASHDKRVGDMIANGALLETERDDATWMLSNAPDRFERIYASRPAGAKVPIGQQQAGAEDPAAKDAPAVTDADKDGKHDLSGLSETDRKAYFALTRGATDTLKASTLTRIRERAANKKKAG